MIVNNTHKFSETPSLKARAHCTRNPFAAATAYGESSGGKNQFLRVGFRARFYRKNIKYTRKNNGFLTTDYGLKTVLEKYNQSKI